MLVKIRFSLELFFIMQYHFKVVVSLTLFLYKHNVLSEKLSVHCIAYKVKNAKGILSLLVALAH